MVDFAEKAGTDLFQYKSPSLSLKIIPKKKGTWMWEM